METILLYILQSFLVAGGFLAVYHIFLKKETLFMENRLFLVAGLVLSFIFPLLKIQQTVVASQPILVQVGETSSQVPATTGQNGFIVPEGLIIALYLSVAILLFIKFITRLLSLRKLSRTANIKKESPYVHMITEKRISPFSFFNYIFYNPRLFEPNELRSVLEHEKVHARQYHTLDILLLEVLKIVFWFNPILWLYQSAIKQNLEYLADHYAVEETDNKKSYQYLMLKQAVDQKEYTLANSFYNSLIKKRIVMLNQNQSKKINILKTLAVMPLLGLLLVSFNIEKKYLYKDSVTLDNVMVKETPKDNKMVELTIDKNTTDADLDNIKKDLAKEGVDFSYTTVRNDDGEIISISLNLSGKNANGKDFSGNYNSNSDSPINPITVLYDDTNNAVSFWNAKKKSKVKIHRTDDSDVSWSTDDEKEIIVKKVDGKKKVFVNGEEVNEDKLHTMDIHLDEDSDEESVFIVKQKGNGKKNVKIEKIGKKKDGAFVMKMIDDKDVNIENKTNVMVIRDSDDDEDIEVSGDDSNFLFISSDDKGRPLYIVDGKKTKQKMVNKISPSDIENVTVLKGDPAIEKYGKKGTNGVIEITTKKNK
ncbi:M56 family metallopeptidase [Flagellimonas marinaquae]|uniref:M56 family metallopeptidase n=1 Tax=Flagellimonas marinaquae TaxID=254955 RepID=UPI002075CFAD|nr:M56 family metallopeptidase [Allomuricauda aquimarina]USD24221.1 TonB-dependent receptor plug domain-containing protein [Allomuricauda aquimarina]